MRKIIPVVMTLALVVLFSTPLIADSGSWVANSDQLVAHANDASESWVPNSDQLSAQDNDDSESWVSNSDQLVAHASDASESWALNSGNCLSLQC